MNEYLPAHRPLFRLLSGLFLAVVAVCVFAGCSSLPVPDLPEGRVSALREVERLIETYAPDPHYPDDTFVLATLREALLGAMGRNGGIGACLVREETGEVVERGHNRQYEPYFRSDLHAEMDLLTRYEESVRLRRSPDPGSPAYRDPRNMAGLVLYTSVEPCPMCLGRIINAGVRKILYAASDDAGGMAQRLGQMPPFWRSMARNLVIERARCSPKLSAAAALLFRPAFAATTYDK